MANPFIVTPTQFGYDGTNIYMQFNLFDGLHTLPPMQASFPSNVTASTITTYLQNVANNQPTLPASIAALLNVPIQGQ
jgi:hypothetical protein